MNPLRMCVCVCVGPLRCGALRRIFQSDLLQTIPRIKARNTQKPHICWSTICSYIYIYRYTYLVILLALVGKYEREFAVQQILFDNCITYTHPSSPTHISCFPYNAKPRKRFESVGHEQRHHHHPNDRIYSICFWEWCYTLLCLFKFPCAYLLHCI